MINGKTLSETCFEEFLSANNLPFELVPTADTPRPDYLVTVQTSQVFFEVKELTEDEKFNVGVHHLRTRIVGRHIRSKISQARRRIKFGAEQGIASALVEIRQTVRLYKNVYAQTPLPADLPPCFEMDR